MLKTARPLALAGILLPVVAALFLSACGGGSTNLFVILNPSTNQSVDVNQSVTFTAFVPNDTTNAGVTWAVTGAHCKGANCGIVSNPTSSSATYVAPKSTPTGNLLTVTLTATSVADKRATATLNIAVTPAPVIQTVSLPGLLNGAKYSQQIVATGGVGPLTFKVTAGTLPPGLNLNTNGSITGRTTSNGGTFDFTVTVTDQGSPPLTDSADYSLVVAPAPALSVTTTALNNAVQGSPYNQGLTATGGVPPLTWSISSGALPAGLTLDAATGQISGTPTTQGSSSFTVEVTDSALLPPNNQPQTATQSLSITVGPPGALTIVTTTLPDANSATLYSQQIRTTGGIGPFNWTLTSGILPSGLSLDPTTGLISGTATAVSTNTFSVQVTDSEAPPAQASATFSINVVASTTNNQLLVGQYVFIFSGYNSSGPVVFGGNLFASGTGAIQGAVDSNNNNPTGSTDNAGPGPTQSNAMAGTYTITSDGRGTMNLSVGSVTSTYNFVLDGNGNGQFIEGDSTGTHGTGILRKQTTPSFTSASFKGNYAFELAGIDSAGKRDALAGVFHADGSSLFDSGTADTNDGGSLGTNLTGLTGSFLAPQNSGLQKGRCNAALAIPNGATLNFICYMISPSDVFFVGLDSFDSTHPMTTGEAVLQTQASFDAGALNGAGVVTETGQTSGGNSAVLVGLLSGNGSGAISANTDSNNGGSIAPNVSASGTYSVASNGRAQTTGISSQLAIIYLISQNQGFVIGQDSAASLGALEARTFAGPYTASSFSSYFTFGPPESGSPLTGSKSTTDFAGTILSDGISSISGKIDETNSAGLANSNLAMKGSYNIAANGRGTMAFGSPTGLPSQFVFYMLSPTQLRAVSAVPPDTQPMLFFLNH
ncbi:MAG TPA: Ig domain-containing protein [Verrucomicrobiae bacterium]|nr:Ig domain-containing protein [Verrucomicrobiae bacterium]